MEQPTKKSLYFEAATMPASGAWAEKRRLAAALRTMIDRLVVSDAPEAQLARAADAAERFQALMEEARARE